jgi:hypothetical protein
MAPPTPVTVVRTEAAFMCVVVDMI